jgi:pimeloyl-ACP methyl ester carboxylesterase
VAVVVIIMSPPRSIAQTSASGPDSRVILSDMRRLSGADAVETLEAVEINGVSQWVSILGADRRNPRRLILHGGPGYVSMSTAWWTTRALEDFFVVVHWDPRGAGLTYVRATDRDAMIESLTYEIMIEDAEMLVAWLRDKFDREKVFVLGQSRLWRPRL